MSYGEGIPSTAGSFFDVTWLQCGLDFIFISSFAAKTSARLASIRFCWRRFFAQHWPFCLALFPFTYFNCW